MTGFGAAVEVGLKGSETRRPLCLDFQANLVLKPTSTMEPAGWEQEAWGEGGGMPGKVT